jgi:hypothetical protein
MPLVLSDVSAKLSVHREPLIVLVVCYIKENQILISYT